MVSLITVYATNALKNFWRDSLDYAQQYYDKLNEIRIVTGMSDEEASRLGDSYRDMAQKMSVSSTEIASAATEFWRQGLGESDVSARLKDTTMYAKISGLAFEEAAELVTAATNSMEIDSQRVVDVFAYLGDASASGADEIGLAMQRASATAQEAGVSFEWLGAYIATVSEKTRQAPESIGTAFNSIMSRLQNIKQMGFNEEDETKINDVSKALKNIGVAIMGQDGQWRNMSDIFTDIAYKWGEMDDKARAYVATTMAGARQKNVFLTLMNDMSKVTSTTGEASRALELYSGALSAAGTASEKYAIWQESITAAQGKLKAEFEELQNITMNPEWIKGFYDIMTNLVGVIADGTEALNGMNLIVPALVSSLIYLAPAVSALGTSIVSIVSGFAGAITGATTLSAAVSILWGVISAHPMGAALTALVGLGVAMTGLGVIFNEEAVDVQKKMRDVATNLDTIRTAQNNLVQESSNIQHLITRYSELTTSTKLTKEQEVELKGVISDILNLCPSLKGVLDEASGSYVYQAEVVAALNKEIQNLNATRQKEIRDAADANLKTLSETDDALYGEDPYSKYIGGYENFRSVYIAQGKSDAEAAKAAASAIYERYAKAYENKPKGNREKERLELSGLRDFIKSLYPDKKDHEIHYEEDYIRYLADYLENNWTLIDNEIAAHQEKISQYQDSVRETLMSYMDLSGIESDTLKEAARKQITGMVES